MRKCILHFTSSDSLQLLEAYFIHPMIGGERRCIRGKRSKAYREYATFQWTRAVQALSILMLEAARRRYVPSFSPMLVGRAGSLASSLDYAIDKQTTWLYDMFGWDEKGSGFSRRLFIRSNPGQRLPAPVAVTLNLTCLEPGEIEILLDYAPVVSAEDLERMIDQLRCATTPKSDVVVTAHKTSSISHRERANQLAAPHVRPAN